MATISTAPYSKQALSYSDQLALLKQRGLVVADCQSVRIDGHACKLGIPPILGLNQYAS